jgi:hypothetical protein
MENSQFKLKAIAAAAVWLMAMPVLAASPIDQCMPRYSTDVLAGAKDADQLTRFTIYNHTGHTIYPLLRRAPDGNTEYRIYGAAIPPASQSSAPTVIAVPRTAMWDAGRLQLLTVNPLADPALLPLNWGEANRHWVDDIAGSPNRGLTVYCSKSVTAGDNNGARDLPPESHSQLLEYTFFQGDNGYPVANYDISYVDHLFLPVAMEVHGGAIGYMGTTSSYDSMERGLTDFVNGKFTHGYFTSTRPTLGWPYYRSGSGGALNLMKLPSGYNVLESANGASSLEQGKSLLVHLDPANGSEISGDAVQVNGLVNRWMGWLTQDTINATAGAAAVLPPGPVRSIGGFNDAQCQADAFCSAYSRAVNAIWRAGWPHVQSHYTAPITPAFLVKQIIGYNEFAADFNPTSPSYPWGSTLNGFRDATKGVLRGVPSLDPAYNNRWYPSPDAFLADGSTPNAHQKYNLDPFVWFVHKALNMGAYGFSIDDDIGNVQVGGSNVIVTIGGAGGLPNDNPWNPQGQQSISFAPGWTTLSSSGFLDACHMSTSAPTNCAINLMPGVTGTFTVATASSTLTATVTGVVGANGGPNTLSFNCSAASTLCQQILLDSATLTLNLPPPAAGPSTPPPTPTPTPSGATSHIYFANGWKSVASANCPVAQNSDDGSVSASNMQGLAKAFSFAIPSGVGACTVTFGRMVGAPVTYSFTASANPTATCTSGCKPNYAGAGISYANGALTVNMPPADAE